MMVHQVITPAIKLTNDRHSGEGRNPEGYLMPDQVRHDAIGDFNCRVNTTGKNSNPKILFIDDEERFRTALAQQLACRQFNQEHG